jgi:membrane protease YdiL (CAAX protease family)
MLILFTLGITGAGFVVFLVSPLIGICLHMGLLFLLIFACPQSARNPSRRLYLALTLALLISIVSLSVPMLDLSEIYWYIIAAITLIAAALIVLRILNLRKSEVGLNIGNVHVQGVIVLTGIGFGIAEYYIIRPEPLITLLSWGQILLPAIILLAATGFVEELIFRGVIQRVLMDALESRYGFIRQ